MSKSRAERKIGRGIAADLRRIDISGTDAAQGGRRKTAPSSWLLWPEKRPVYGTRVVPGKYQTRTRAVPGQGALQTPLALLRMLMLRKRSGVGIPGACATLKPP
jgi:hypothetical protein